MSRRLGVTLHGINRRPLRRTWLELLWSRGEPLLLLLLLLLLP